jgi:hypothetical protein
MVKAMKRQMHFVTRSEFVRGLSSLLDISYSRPRGHERRGAMQALRGDMAKIGADFHRVIERERDDEKAPAARKESPADN